MQKSLSFIAVVALAVLMPAVAGQAAPPGPVEQLLTPWQGYSSFLHEGSSIVANPAALSELDEFAVGMQTVRPLSDTQPTGMAYSYREPDIAGIGAGQIAYASLTEGDEFVSRFAYSGAKQAGNAASIGLGVTHTKLKTAAFPGEEFTTWGFDFGFHANLFGKWLGLGAVVQNAYLLGDEGAADMLPPTLAAGANIDLGVVRIAGDYLLRGRQAPFIPGYKIGVEGRLGNFSARFGKRSVPADDAHFVYTGIGYRFDRGYIDLLLGERGTGQSLALGVSLYF